MQNVFKRQWIGNYTFERCFRVTRQTQVEDLVDPFKDKSSAMYTNVLSVALYWNVMSTISSVFLVYASDCQKHINNSSKFKIRFEMFAIISGIAWAASFMSFVINMEGTQSVLCIVPASVFLLLVYYIAYWCKYSTMDDEEVPAVKMIDFVCKVVFWVGYTMSVPVVMLGSNMLAQRRDWFYNTQTVLMTTGIGIGMCAAEFAYSAATERLHAITKNKDSSMNLLSAGTVLMNSDSERRQKNDIIFDIMSCIILQMFVMWCGEFPTFPRTTFSNARQCSCVCMALLMLLPVVQTVRLAVKSPQAHELARTVEHGGTWIPQLSAVEFVARIIFTFALIYDLRSLSRVDSIPL